MQKNYLMVFVKNLLPGTVKTRIAKDIGMDAALEVYKELLNYTAEVADKVDAEKTDKGIYYNQYVELYDDWDSEQYQKHVQVGDKLGDKMLHAFTEAFERGYEKVVIIGSDTLEIEVSHIQEAYTALDKHDVVFGPAEDGGYYLLGLNNIFPAIFEEKEYSHEHVLNEALDEEEKWGMSFHLLDKLHDIDTMEDLKRAGYEVIYEEDEEGESGGEDELY